MQAFPSQESVAKRLGCCRNTLRKCIQNLVDKDYIKIVGKQGRNKIY